ncbi:T9SS type A sorting domain-containing protein [Aequorivita sp. 609]|uniref:T9SS type A sorting domain-containing protein n=1 Tax=Aequorivita TaxID=153265 RepID=UPI00161096D4|nr:MULTISPECIES: T9SS type A sorting domain-containing protein [Aequorivita]MBB6680485.1 T9SS type A sorting domain-containing protein [Aequorivita sp. 609]
MESYLNFKKIILYSFLLYGAVSMAQFSQKDKVVSQNRESRAEFGTSVAIKDNFAIVGASRESYAEGAAYIYTKDSQGNWSFTQRIAANDPNEGAEYGGGVKISDDFLVVAAGRADIESTVRAGALYIYDFQNNNWEFNTKLVASDLSGDAKLGMNPTSIDVQNETIIAGAPGEDSWTGSVYVFNRINGNWSETQKIMSPTPMVNDAFGIGVSISGDYLLIGAQGVNNSEGSAYLYIKNNDGVWEYDQTITASDSSNDSYFGSSVSVSENIMVIGSYGVNSEKGAAYVYEKNNQGIWEEVQILISNPSNDYVQFGWDTAILQDYIIIAAPHIYGNEKGEVYFYNKENTGLWVENQIIQGNDTESEDFYGWSIASNGSDLIIGSPREDHDINGSNPIDDAGSAYIFENPNILGGLTNLENYKNSIRYYPNPILNVLKINSSTKLISSIKLFTINGSLLIEKNEINNNLFNIDFSNYSNGFYLINVLFEDGTSTYEKLIKTNY